LADDRYLICGEDGGKNTGTLSASRRLEPGDWRHHLRQYATSVRTATPRDRGAVLIAGGDCVGPAVRLRGKNGG